MKIFLSIFLLAVFIFSCGKVNRNNKPLGGRFGTITRTFVDTAVNHHTNFFLGFSGSTNVTDINKFGALFERTFRRTLFKMATNLLDTCTPSKSGQTTDADNDNIPANATMNINCLLNPEYIVGSATIIDQDDNKGLDQGLAGMTVTIDPIDLRVTMNSSLLTGALSAGGFNVAISPNQTTISVDVSGNVSYQGATAVFAAEGSGTYSGNANSPKDGDTGSGFFGVKYKGTNVSNLPDQDFVLEVTTNFSMGTCGLSPHQLKDGEATAIDGSGNIVKLIASNCDFTLTYNGIPISIPTHH